MFREGSEESSLGKISVNGQSEARPLLNNELVMCQVGGNRIR